VENETFLQGTKQPKREKVKMKVFYFIFALFASVSARSARLANLHNKLSSLNDVVAREFRFKLLRKRKLVFFQTLVVKNKIV